MGIITPRLYRKKSGIYWVRILLSAGRASDSPDAGNTTNLDTAGAQRARFSPSRSEIRRSLGTADARHAHNVGAQLNAVLASTAQSAWSEAVSNFFSNPHLTSPWTITSQGISADGDDDQRRLDAFLRANPDFRDAVLYAIRNSGQQAANAMSSAAAVGSNSPIAMVNACTSSNAGLAPSKPHRFEETIEKFLLRCQERAIKARTAQDIAAVIRNLSRFMTTSDPQMGEDPWVHLVNTTHISDFIDAQKKRSGKHMEASGKSSGLKASTLKKRLLDLGTFFRYAHKELKACMVNPVSDLDHRLADLGRVAVDFHVNLTP